LPTRPPDLDELLAHEKWHMGRDVKLLNAHVFAEEDEHVFFFVYDCEMDLGGVQPLAMRERRFAVYVNDRQLYSGIIPSHNVR
jgi:hypothetical protein